MQTQTQALPETSYPSTAGLLCAGAPIQAANFAEAWSTPRLRNLERVWPGIRLAWFLEGETLCLSASNLLLLAHRLRTASPRLEGWECAWVQELGQSLRLGSVQDRFEAQSLQEFAQGEFTQADPFSAGLVLKRACLLATAKGVVREQEKKLLLGLCDALGTPREALEGYLDKLLAQGRGATTTRKQPLVSSSVQAKESAPAPASAPASAPETVKRELSQPKPSSPETIRAPGKVPTRMALACSSRSPELSFEVVGFLLATVGGVGIAGLLHQKAQGVPVSAWGVAISLGCLAACLVCLAAASLAEIPLGQEPKPC